jgi:tripartite-type tricarboxylate transporter receptor subunit TctC
MLAACAPDESPWPSRPIKIEVGYPPGGGADALARLVASELGRALDGQVVVENRPGSAGTFAAQLVAQAPRDGYTLLVAATGAVTLAPLLNRALSYAPDKDLCPLALLGETPHVLLVNAVSPAQSLDELVALARQHPSALSYASLGQGSSAHVTGARFASLTHIAINHVPYRGSAPAINDLIGGHVSMMFGTLQATLPMIESGQVRVLAVSSERRSPKLPSVPTFAEQGFPELTSTSWYGLFMPCGVPPAVARKLDIAARKVVEQGALAARVEGEGSEFRALIGQDFARFLDAERARWKSASALAGSEVSDDSDQR